MGYCGWIETLPGINTRAHAGSAVQTVRVMDGWMGGRNTAVRLVGLTELVGSVDRVPA